ncbi:hypothetical protein DL93DRAFT_2090588 [Clavulina sp. PMI_390]|nr:hypothetical protein DL93DRAFT_2090588 [Clavulina sp. PMI_390]
MAPTPTSPEAVNINDATIASHVPDSHTRRYDRQLRLWAASGQSALESARVLVLSGTATSAQALKNLVLPGIGTYTVLDAESVSPEDAGNNFFVTHKSIGTSRAEEVAKLLGELNENVIGKADTRGLAKVLAEDPNSLRDYTLIIAHNIPEAQLNQVSGIVWGDMSYPPLIVVKTAGFLAEFSVQLHEHTIVDAHTDDLPSYRLDKAFPALLKHSVELNFDALDVTDHGHIPYFIILVRALHDWKSQHQGKPPAYKELKEFKANIEAMKKKSDEENFEEAVAQVFKAYRETTVPSSVQELFSDPACVNVTANSTPFFLMLHALSIFVSPSNSSQLHPPNVLPLSPTLPDIKADTANYIHLQSLYKAQANAEKAEFVQILRDVCAKAGVQTEVPTVLIDEFVKNCHQLRVLKGKRAGAEGEDNEKLMEAIQTNPSQVATHLAFNALYAFHTASTSGSSQSGWPEPGSEADLAALMNLVDARLKAAGFTHPPEEEEDENALIDEAATGPANVSFKKHLENAVGELVRAPTAELPTTAALVGGLVAQEAIKLITRQYVPIEGICVIDLISSTTGCIRL